MHGYFSKWVSLGMHSLALYRDHGLASWSSQTLSRSYCTFQSMNIGPHWGTAVAYTVQTAEAAVRGWRHRLRALQALTTASACTSTETVHLFSLFATRTYCNPHGVHGEEPKMRPLFFFFLLLLFAYSSSAQIVTWCDRFQFEAKRSGSSFHFWAFVWAELFSISTRQSSF